MNVMKACVCVQVPSVEFGLTLAFEGYELTRAGYSQTCTQGKWMIQNRRSVLVSFVSRGALGVRVFNVCVRRLCGVRALQPYAERIFLLSSTVTVAMTSEVSLTGPGLQVTYSIFNQSDRECETVTLTHLSFDTSECSRGFSAAQHVRISFCVTSTASASRRATASPTVPTVWTRETAVNPLIIHFFQNSAEVSHM